MQALVLLENGFAVGCLLLDQLLAGSQFLLVLWSQSCDFIFTRRASNLKSAFGVKLAMVGDDLPLT